MLAAGIALAIAAASFAAAGGLRLERTTNVLIAAMLASAALVVTAIIQRPWTRDAPLYGGGALLAFAVLAAGTALSVIWSLAPSDSWIEAARTFAYLALFAAGMALVRLEPQGWSAVLVGVAGGCLIVCAWALLTKVFPASLASEETYARLREPFAYWNSVGLMAALGVPPLLWLAARRSGHAAANALAWPGIGLLLVCLMLSYSRGALVALLIGLALWFAVVPLRLRGTVALAAAVLGAGPLVAWAFSQDGLTTDRAPIAARVDAGHEFGALLLLMVALLLAAGLAVQFAAAQRSPTPHQRRLAGRAALAVLALVPVFALIALAAAPGGVDGQVSKAWNQLTDPNAKTPANTPDRLTATSSVRARYWSEALDIHATEPLLGTGAGAYATVRTRFRDDTLAVRHAHGYVVQTLADLGWAGLAVFDRGGGVGWPPCAPPASRAATAACRTTPSGSGCSRSRRRRRLRRALGRRLDLVRPGQRRRRDAVRRLGGGTRAAARPARGARRAARPRRPGVAAREPARAAGESAAAAGARGDRRDRDGAGRGVDRVPAGARRPRRRRRLRPARPGSAGRRRRHRADRHRAQPARGRPAVRAVRDRAGARSHRRGRGGARARRRAAAGQRGGVAAARPPAAVGAERPAGRADAFQAAYYLDPKSQASTSDVLEASRAAQSPTGAEPTP